MENLSKKEKVSYSFGAFGNNLIYGLVATYLIKFYTDYLLIPALAITALFIVARIWDAINDPFMGYLVDNTDTKFGRFRPYLLFTPWLVGLFAILCFVNPGFSTTGNIIWAFATYILFGMAFTAMDIPYWSMTPALTQDITERSSIVTTSRTVASVGYFLGMILAYPILVDAFGGDSLGWTATAIVFSAIGIFFTLVTFANTKERHTVKKKGKYTVKDMFNQFKTNTPLLTLMGALLFVEIANAIKIIFPTYYFEQNLMRPDLISTFLFLYALFLIIGSLLSPVLMKKIGKKKTAIIGVLLLGVFSIIHFFVGYESIPLILVTNGLSSFGFGLANIAMMSMLADTVEFGQWKTGIRTEGMVFSTNIFKTKVATAIGGALGALGLAFYMYQPNVTLSKETLDGIHLMISFVPGIIALVGILPLCKYTITETVYQSILADIESKNN